MADDNYPAYDVREIAEKIAKGHSYKHVDPQNRFSVTDNNHGKYGPDLNIKASNDTETQQRFADHIEKTLLDPETKVFRGVDEDTGRQTRDIYFNKDSNTVVIVNRDDPDGGTCYRDKTKEAELTRLFEGDIRNREIHGLPPPEVPQIGGYERLYPGHAQEQIRAMTERVEQAATTPPLTLAERIRANREARAGSADGSPAKSDTEPARIDVLRAGMTPERRASFDAERARQAAIDEQKQQEQLRQNLRQRT